MLNTTEKLNYKLGIKDGLPIGLGYLSVSFGFGVTAVTGGLPIFIAILISMTNLTSAGQLAGAEIISQSGSLLLLILSQLTINSRYFLMSTSLSQKIDASYSLKHRLLSSIFITDEIFAVAISKKTVSPAYFYGLSTLPYICWTIGTILGAVAGNVLPSILVSALGISLYAMFIAIIIPPMQKSKGVFVVVILSTIFSVAFYFVPYLNQISSPLAIIICAIIATAIVSFIFPIKQDSKENAL